MSAPDHWAAGLIGLPWVAGKSDCWSFARRVWADRFGWDVPPVPVDPASPVAGRRALGVSPEGLGWRQVDRPAEGDGVMMAKGAHNCHVGVWIEPDQTGGILHSVEGAGVIFTPLPALAAMGYRVTGFWRHP